ncbi:50S ribosome-binding GTPase [Candidatus Fermentibacteria bacterium]|nr:50S ribosome-binding GTPase [Candidatus Fermentibacteria bacterium]
MNRESLRIVIVGHVDHGKSTLIGRLFYDTGSLPPEKMREIERISEDLGHDTELAFLMDHLQEERDQGITIDTAQTFFKTATRDYVIIDAPGHRQFLKNMITGASQAEAALLVVDAEEGVREQTRRHAYLLSLLGLRQLVVAVNKMDTVEFSESRFREVTEELAAFLSGIASASTYMVPISARRGDNVARRSQDLPWYEGPTILEALDRFQPVEPQLRPFRFPVQGIYPRDGTEIVAGRVESGMVRSGDELLVLPSGVRTTVTGVHEFLATPTVLEPGQSGGITVSIAKPARGDMLVALENPPTARTSIPATVFWMSRQPLSLTEPLTFRCTTQEVPCRVARIRRRLDSSTLTVIDEDADTLADTEVAELELETGRPVVVEEHAFLPELGRFVLERGYDVVAGGIVTSLPA